MRQPPLPEDFRSALHGPRVTARLGVWLGAAFGICFLTGIVSHLQQHPLPFFVLPPDPSWAYRVTQGIHVAAGTASVPLLLFTGIANGAGWYVFGVGFTQVHFAFAWVAIDALVIHLAVKLPVIRTALSALGGAGGRRVRRRCREPPPGRRRPPMVHPGRSGGLGRRPGTH